MAKSFFNLNGAFLNLLFKILLFLTLFPNGDTKVGILSHLTEVFTLARIAAQFQLVVLLSYLIFPWVLRFFVSKIEIIFNRLDMRDFLSSFSLEKFINSFRTHSMMFFMLSLKVPSV